MKVRAILLPSIMLLIFAVPFLAGTCDAQIKFNLEPISYSKAAAQGAIARLQKQIDTGQKQLKFDAKTGYLASVLEALGVSTDSQMLVFSKTSFQQRRISPSTPRALYFNDGVYVGWVPGGEEMTA